MVSIPQVSKSVFAAAILLSILIWAIAFYRTASDVADEPGGDLRNRVTGARRLMDGINPYLPADAPLPEYYQSVTPTTVTPAHLLLYAPLRRLTWGTQRWTYFALDWVFLVLFVFVLHRIFSLDSGFWLTLTIISLVLVADASFELHFARGQIYLTLLFISSVFAAGVYSGKQGWLSAIALALLILLRPTYCLVWLGTLILGLKGLAKRAAIALAVLLLGTVIFTGVTAWSEYADLLLHAGQVHFDPSMNSTHYGVPAIEGINFLASKSFHGWEHDRTFLGLFEFGPFHDFISYERLLTQLNSALLILCVCGSLYLLFRMRFAADAVHKTVLLLLIPIALETFGPQRYGYADVMLALPLMFVLAPSIRSELAGSGPRIRTVLFGLALAFGFSLLSRLTFLPFQGFLAVVRNLLVIFFFILYSVKAFAPQTEQATLSSLLRNLLVMRRFPGGLV